MHPGKARSTGRKARGDGETGILHDRPDRNALPVPLRSLVVV